VVRSVVRTVFSITPPLRGHETPTPRTRVETSARAWCGLRRFFAGPRGYALIRHASASHGEADGVDSH